MLKYSQAISFACVREERQGIRKKEGGKASIERKRIDRKEMKGKTGGKKGKERKGKNKTNNGVLPTVNTSAINLFLNKFCNRNLK